MRSAGLKAAVIVAFFAALLFAALLFKQMSAKPKAVVRVERPNAQLILAMKKAKKQLPYFIKRLKDEKNGEQFAIDVRFETPDGNEYLWVRDPKLVGSKLDGILDQRPMALQDIKKGDHVSVAIGDVVDWMIHDTDGSTEGGFTNGPLSKPGG